VVTIRDVARAAGVSIATVSRVFNGSSRVSSESSRRVRAAAKRLDYWPHSGARSLTTARTQALGVLLPDLFGEFFSEVIRGIDHTARSHMLQILVSSSHADTEQLVAAARSLSGRIDGLIAMVPDKGSVAGIQSIARRFPVVLLSPRLQVHGCSSVSIANHAGASALVRHLLELGHRRIAILKGPLGNVDAEERLRGYRDTLRAAGVEPEPGLEFQGDFTEASGYRAGSAILRLQPRPAAVFAANDYMAIGLLCALRDAGIEVPHQMAVTGFDDIAIARYLNPPLTTVHVDTYEMGVRAARSLIDILGAPDGDGHSRIELPAGLVVRTSCGSRTASGARARAERRGAATPRRRNAAPLDSPADGGTRSKARSGSTKRQRLTASQPDDLTTLAPRRPRS
jgi:LacI family transcriptional regulator